MGRPETTSEKRKLMHPTKRTSSTDSHGTLVEAYKKHAEQLRWIEDRQDKTIGLLLGIFGAAGTLLIKEGVHMGWQLTLYVSVISVLIAVMGQHAITELHDLRVAARDLLVRCEIALGLYEVDRFLDRDALYTEYERDYPKRGTWMKQNSWIVWIVCAGFIVLLWWVKFNSHTPVPFSQSD
jgi:hypothetical protein